MCEVVLNGFDFALYPPTLRDMDLTQQLTMSGCFFFFQAEDGIRDLIVTGVQTCALPISADVRKITQAMRTDVLRVDEYPGISFVSTSVTPSDEGFHLQGRLTLAGQTRDVSCDIRAEIGTDTLRATGSFSVKQTDFGIRPYRGGPAGTVRVADRAVFSFDAVGVRAPEP